MLVGRLTQPALRIGPRLLPRKEAYQQPVAEGRGQKLNANHYWPDQRSAEARGGIYRQQTAVRLAGNLGNAGNDKWMEMIPVIEFRITNMNLRASVVLPCYIASGWPKAWAVGRMAGSASLTSDFSNLFPLPDTGIKTGWPTNPAVRFPFEGPPALRPNPDRHRTIEEEQNQQTQ